LPIILHMLDPSCALGAHDQKRQNPLRVFYEHGDGSPASI